MFFPFQSSTSLEIGGVPNIQGVMVAFACGIISLTAEPSDAGDVAGAGSFESFINLEARVNRPRA